MQAQSPRPLLVPVAEEPEHRRRLLEGMALAVSEKSYGEVTIADVVQKARVSKRTFYEHFADKEACFLATYAAISAELLGVIADAALAAPAGELQIEAACQAYFAALEERRPLVRAFLSEIHAAGPAALSLRRTIHRRFAELLSGLVARARRSRPEIRALSTSMALAVVGGINELLLLHLADDGGEPLSDVRSTAIELVTSVLEPKR
jgi:AcrR family transcriptional regulator